MSYPSLCVQGARLAYYYQQGMYNTACVFSSMALAALALFVGTKNAASHIQNKAKGTSGCNVQGMFHRLKMQVHRTELKFLSANALPPMFDWKNNIKDNIIMVALLEGSDRSVHHAVTMFQGGGNKLEKMLSTFRGSEDMPVEAPQVTEVFNKVQKAVKDQYREICSKIFRFDETLNKQRTSENTIAAMNQQYNTDC
jgi:hypothetical protein